MGAVDEPGIEDVLGEELLEVRRAMTQLSNATGQDDHPDGWDETVTAVGNLEDAVENLYVKTRDEYRKRQGDDT